ncbi:MAG: isoamylase [Nitrospira sp.]|nr:isoamylase [Nitrospira sp.]
MLSLVLFVALVYPLFSCLEAGALGSKGLGVTGDDHALTFRIYSSRATRLELWLYGESFGAEEKARVLMTKDPATHLWAATLPRPTIRNELGIDGVIYYGYRAWGPNWTYDPSWTKGSEIGFHQDVDGEGNRFNPNKLLLDPYAIEVSHDPVTPRQSDGGIYASGQGRRRIDTGAAASKGVIIANAPVHLGARPTRPFKDDIIYEVHLRGFTRNDASIPKPFRGTYRGAGLKAPYLNSIGVTAVEFLPVHELQNEANDVVQSTKDDDYWGYSNYNYFAPDRRYAADKAPGGPTREWREMVRAFHDHGIKVYLDVVYNHTGEGGLWDGDETTANIISYRGLDNPSYYELTADNKKYYDCTGVNGNFNAAHEVIRDLIVDSLAYWKNDLGVDGFRFDLAPLLGNTFVKDGFRFNKFDSKNALNRAVRELPARPAAGGEGVDLIAEPWMPKCDGQQQGNFPSGWAEWNDKFRNTFREHQNKLGIAQVTPGQLAMRFAGSEDWFKDDGRRPWHSVNFMAAHDGFTLRDLYSYNSKQNNQPWPLGPSDGGTDDNRSWDQGGDQSLQRQAARNGLAFLMLSSGVPMITGGDEMYRTQFGNNNPYNLDSEKIYLDYAEATRFPAFFRYAKKLMVFRLAHPSLRPATFFDGTDHNGNALKDITWLSDRGGEADEGYMRNPDNHFLAYRLDGTEAEDSVRSIYVAYNGWSERVTATLPVNLTGAKWYRVGDTAAWMESKDNFTGAGQEELMEGDTYVLAGRSVLVLVEK